MTGPRPIAEALADLTRRVMSLPGVVGTAEASCDGKPCLKVFVVQATSELIGKIPTVVGGYQVTTEQTGAFRAFGSEETTGGSP